MCNEIVLVEEALDRRSWLWISELSYYAVVSSATRAKRRFAAVVREAAGCVSNPSTQAISYSTLATIRRSLCMVVSLKGMRIKMHPFLRYFLS